MDVFCVHKHAGSQTGLVDTSTNFASKQSFSAIFAIYHWKCIWSGILQYSTVRCEKRIVNNETRWRIQANSAKISQLTEVFALDIVQNCPT